MAVKPKTEHRRRLILVALNEVNFEVVQKYLARHSLPSFQTLLSGHFIRTTAEQTYEELEPWIQWPSIHNGLSAAEHGIFRLGDVVSTQHRQIFEDAEDAGIKVGSISAMNAENKLKRPAYFIPDPWTRTPSDGSWWSEKLSKAVSQVVNDNASGRVSTASKIYLLAGLIKFSRWNNIPLYSHLIAHIRGRPWNKALLLDVFLHDLHLKLLNTSNAEFSTVFLNAGAHIQHHYLLNAAPVRQETNLSNPEWYIKQSEDPILDMLVTYDQLIRDYLDMPSTELIIATGLAQRPYDRAKFYYRLKHHHQFLEKIGVKFSQVTPRMTRDFLVEFNSIEETEAAKQFLSTITVQDSNLPLFGEIDSRGTSLFVTMTYPNEITRRTRFSMNGQEHELYSHVAFVAIKNGMHQSEGYAYLSSGIAPYAPPDRAHVRELNSTIRRYLGLPLSSLAHSYAARLNQ